MNNKDKKYRLFLKEIDDLKTVVDKESVILINSLLEIYRYDSSLKSWDRERKLVSRIHEKLKDNSHWNDIRIAYDLPGV